MDKRRQPQAPPKHAAASGVASERTDGAKRFTLAPLTKLDPAMVVPQDGTPRFPMFMLALALVFNDLKGLLLLFEPLEPTRPGGAEISAHSGEWRGLDMQLHRLRVALLHELLRLINTFQAEATGPEMTQLLRKIRGPIRSQWKRLVEVASDQPGKSAGTFTKQLVQIRNGVAFHYYQPKTLLAGYRRHFFNCPRDPANSFAYCSIGKNMEQTRFYYADAAVSGALLDIQTNDGGVPFLPALTKLANSVNLTLEAIIEEYVRPARRR